MENSEYQKRLQEHAQLQRSQKGQLCSSPPTRDQLLSKHAGVKRYISIQSDQTFVVQPAEVGACRRKFSELQEVAISELRLQTVHRGHYLLVQLIVEPLKFDCISTVVQDRKGDVAKLCIYNFVSAFSDEDSMQSLSVGTVIAIKEPFFKLLMDKTPALRCDHPTDLLIVGNAQYVFDFELVKLSPWHSEHTQDTDACAIKQQADQLYNHRRFAEAAATYGRAIQRDEANAILFLNRAAAFLQLGAYTEARADAVRMLSIDPTNPKALFRAAKSEYGLRRFSAAAKHLEMLLWHHPNTKDAVSLMEEVRERVRESQGQYDWKRMFRLSQHANGQVRLDCADYIGPVKTVQIANKGRGLVATSNLQPGALVMCVKALAVAFASECCNITTLHEEFLNSPTSSKLVEKLCTQMFRDSDLRKRAYTMFAGYVARRENEQVVDSDAHEHNPFQFDEDVVDTQRVSRICFFNEMAIDRTAQVTIEEQRTKQFEGGNENGTGLWLEPALLNHSCLANCNRTFVGDVLVVRALRLIKEGEELTFSYLPFYESASGRQQLFDKHQFKCECALCDADRKENLDELVKRQALFARFINQVVPHVGDPRADPQELTSQLANLVEEMRSAYAKSERQDRFELMSPLFALAHLYQRVDKAKNSIACLTELVQIAIPQLQMNDAASIKCETMHYSSIVLQAVVQLGALCLQAGDSKQARFWKQVAGELHKFDIADDPDLFQLRFGSVLSDHI